MSLLLKQTSKPGQVPRLRRDGAIDARTGPDKSLAPPATKGCVNRRAYLLQKPLTKTSSWLAPNISLAVHGCAAEATT